MTRVLVVDDSAVDRRLAGGILEKHPSIEIEYAENGADALAMIKERTPELVVTDLQMPNLNGLELVEAVRSRHPLIPVILMTAHGSEEIAVRALEAGAASYVPKVRLGTDLLDTVDTVLSLSRADQRQEKLLSCMRESESTFELENDASLIPPLVEYLQEQLSRMELCDETGRIRVGVALEEALLNALYHGNLEISTEQLREASSNLLENDGHDVVAERAAQPPYCDRRIRLKTKITPDESVYIVEDDGPGYDPAEFASPDDPASLERETGRGLMLMRTFMDRVEFSDRGNKVTLVKLREASAVG